MENRKKRLIFIILAIICGGLIYYLLSPSDQPVSAHPLQGGDGRVTRIMRILQFLDNRLKHPTSDQDREANELRRGFFANQATELARPTIDPKIAMSAKQTAIANATKDAEIYNPMPTKTRKVGLMTDPGYVSQVMSEAKVSQTYYVGKLGEGYIIIYAGNLKSDPSQGVIYTFKYTNKTISTDVFKKWEKFLLPQKTGTIRIVSSDDMQLMIVDESGRNFTFNITTQKFNGSPDRTATPSPIVSPGAGTPYPEP